MQLYLSLLIVIHSDDGELPVTSIDQEWYSGNMSTSIIDSAESTILARVIAPNEPTLSVAVAKEFLKWGFSEADQQRMSELAAKARAGSLTDGEQAEIEGYERVSSFLGLVKSKARRSLTASSEQ